MKLFIRNIFLLFILSNVLIVPVYGQKTDHSEKDHPQLVLVFVLDGLRPDLITPKQTPNLYRLQQEGIFFTNSHAVFPTVTRVNSAAISTGTYPEKNGIVSNNMYVPAISSNQSFSTGNYKNLLKLKEKDEEIITTRTLVEILHEFGKKVVAISSGSTGSAFLLNPNVSEGIGVLINGFFEKGQRVAFPNKINQAILEKFGPIPPEKEDNKNQAVNWTEQVLRSYVIPTLQPDVILNWLTEPDHTEHKFGTGSNHVLNTLKNDDRNIGLVLEELKNEGLYKQTDVFVISDHGFSSTTYTINLKKKLINAGLKNGNQSDDVILASNGQAVLLYVKQRDKTVIKRIVEYLQHQPWAGVIFTSTKEIKKLENNPYGGVPGTFSLQYIHEAHPTRRPDIILTFPWSSKKNAFGYSGSHFKNTYGNTGPVLTNEGGHGGMSSWDVRNTFIAWGKDFKKSINIKNPVGNVDVAPTILSLYGLDQAANSMDGRVICEAVINKMDQEKVPVETHIFEAQAVDGKYKIILQVSSVDHQIYVDKSWRSK